MPHFAHDLLASDPEALVQLREALHGQRTVTATLPGLAERFGAVPASAVPQRKVRRRRQSTGAATGSLVSP